MNHYTYDRVGRNQYEIRGRGEGVIARTDDHRWAEAIVDALNREDAATPPLPLYHDADRKGQAGELGSLG